MFGLHLFKFRHLTSRPSPKNQIFVPEQCVPSAHLMKQFDNLEEHFQGLSLSEEDQLKRANTKDASQGEIEEHELYHETYKSSRIEIINLSCILMKLLCF